MANETNYRRPYILKSLYLGLMFFLLLAIIFVLFYRDNLFLLFYLLATGLIIAIFFTRAISKYFAKKQVFGYLNQFNPVEELGAYKEAMNTAFSPEKKYQHFVLLIHGFTASPHEMQHLIDDLEKQGIPYFAPMLTGFGLTDFHLLDAVRYQDFFRSILFYYDFLSQISEKVSIIAHSMGAILATYIAQQRSVDQLILSAPALYFYPEDKFIIRLLTAPIISDIILKIVPYMPKTVKKSAKNSSLNSKVANTRFQYLSVPTHAIQQMLLAKQQVDITQVKTKNLTIIYGELDNVVNIKKCLSIIAEKNMPHTTYCIPDIGHNLFEDTNKHQATSTVISCLTNSA